MRRELAYHIIHESSPGLIFPSTWPKRLSSKQALEKIPWTGGGVESWGLGVEQESLTPWASLRKDCGAVTYKTNYQHNSHLHPHCVSCSRFQILHFFQGEFLVWSFSFWCEVYLVSFFSLCPRQMAIGLSHWPIIMGTWINDGISMQWPKYLHSSCPCKQKFFCWSFDSRVILEKPRCWDSVYLLLQGSCLGVAVRTVILWGLLLVLLGESWLFQDYPLLQISKDQQKNFCLKRGQVEIFPQNMYITKYSYVS